MSESVSVRCPACRREHLYAAPSYPCVCGAPVAPRLDQGAPVTAVTRQVWNDQWVTVRCASCGRRDQWPRPELGCPCGTVLRIPVRGTTSAMGGPDATAATEPAQPAQPARRPSVQPLTIRTARDAVIATALYLRRLGHEDIRGADQRPPSGVGLAARGLLAQVEPTVRPASLRDVECLWLTAMSESASCVYFSLAGYTADARSRADALGIPLFVLDLAGSPQPVNAAADHLDAGGV